MGARCAITLACVHTRHIKSTHLECRSPKTFYCVSSFAHYSIIYCTINNDNDNKAIKIVKARIKKYDSYGRFIFDVIFERKVTLPALVFNSLKTVFNKGPSFHFWKSIWRSF